MSIQLKFSLSLVFLISSLVSEGQTWDWTQYVTEGGNDYLQDIKTDNLGNVYTTGRARNEARFTNLIDSNSIFTPDIADSDTWVAKYSPNGELLWVSRNGGLNKDAISLGYSIAIDQESNIYNTGVFTDNFAFANDTIIATPDSLLVQQVFLTKHDSQGNELWIRVGRSIDKVTRKNSIGLDVKVNSNGEIISTGWIYGRFVFENDTIGRTDFFTAFVSSYDSDGNLNWVTGKDVFSRGYELGINSSDEIIVVGDVGFGQRGLLIEKLSKDGNLVWEKSNFNGGTDKILSVDIDVNDNIYIAGVFEEEIGLDSVNLSGPLDNSYFIGKLHDNGEVEYLRHILTCDSTLDNFTIDMQVVDNNILVCGTFWGSVFFENDTIVSIGDADGFIACFDTIGNYKWVKHLKGVGALTGGVKRSDGIKCLELDGNNNLFAGGFLYENVRFDSTYFPGVRGTSAFVGKMFLPLDPVANIEDLSICQGDSSDLIGSAYGSPLQYEWIIDSTIETGSDVNIVFSNSGEYNIQLVVSNLYVSDTLKLPQLQVNPNPVVNLGMDTIICENNILLLDAGLDFENYLWSTGELTSTISVSTSGNYFVEVTDSNQCVGGDEISVVVDPCTGTDNFSEVYVNSYPNPSYGNFYLDVPDNNYVVDFYNSSGNHLISKDLTSGKNEFDFRDEPNTLLFYVVHKKGYKIHSGRLILIKE